MTETLAFGSLAAGVGGIDIGFELAGMICAWQVEISDFCIAILNKRWSEVEKFRDIRDCGAHNLAPVDVIVGGIPCQPFSQAGKRRGGEDDRNLWPEMARIVSEIRPAWVVVENVPRIRNIYLDKILSDLEDLDYTGATLGIPACAIGAPHLRERYFVVAYTKEHCVGTRLRESEQAKERKRRFSDRSSTLGRRWPPEPDVGRVRYGVSSRVERLTAIGNAVVPQVAELIGSLIMASEIEMRARNDTSN